MRIMGGVGETAKVKGMFITPKELEEALCHFTEVSQFQLVVDQIEHRDKLYLQVELKDEGVDRERLAKALQDKIGEACRVKPDSCDFVPQGTITERNKVIVDRRVWE